MSISTKKMETRQVDSGALVCLRAFASLNILFGHLVDITTSTLDLQGGSSVQLFFLLSGFVLALAYGKRNLVDLPACHKFAKEFYAKRAARLLPIYFVSLLASMYFYRQFIEGAGMVTFVLQWFLLTSWYGDAPMDGPLWQISSMVFLYLAFPYILPLIQRIRKNFLWYSICYTLQALFFYVLLFTAGYFEARGLMISRLPLFVMGILLGLERQFPNQQQCCMCYLYPSAACMKHYPDLLCLSVFILMGFGAILSIWLGPIPRLCLEPLLTHLQGLMIYSMTTDACKDSMVGKIARLPVVIHLSTISLSTYAVQEIVFRYYGSILFRNRSA